MQPAQGESITPAMEEPTMHEDRYGLPLSSPSTVARDAYAAGVDSVLSGIAGYRASQAQAIAADPGFALAHVALARGLFMDGDMGPARALLARCAPRRPALALAALG